MKFSVSVVVLLPSQVLRGISILTDVSSASWSWVIHSHTFEIFMLK